MVGYKKNMTDREVARAAMDILRNNASLIADANDSNKVWDLIEAVDVDNATKKKGDRL